MKKENVIAIIENLREYYPEAKCSLDFETPFQLMVAVLMSAQCTDERVNKVTKVLFEKYGTPEVMANADLDDIEKIIKSCGFYKNKSKNIKNLSIMLVNEYNGIVPENINELEKFPGIGRKSANVIMTDAFNNAQGIAVDTHVKRLSNRIGLSNKKEPLKIEEDLLKIIPKEKLKDMNHLFMWLGRDKCNARNPICDECPIKELCEKNI